MPFVDMLTVTATVWINSAEGLPDRERFGKNDPYVKIKCAGQKEKSPVCEDGGTAPVWEGGAPLKFTFGDRAMFDRTQATITVYNKNTMSDSVLGTVKIRFDEIVAAIGENTAGNLDLADNDGDFSGHLNVRVEVFDPVAERARQAEEAVAREAAAAEAEAARVAAEAERQQQEEIARAAREAAQAERARLEAEMEAAEEEAREAAEAALAEAQAAEAAAQAEADRLQAEAEAAAAAEVARVEAEAAAAEAEAERQAELEARAAEAEAALAAIAAAEAAATEREATALKTVAFFASSRAEPNSFSQVDVEVPEGYKLIGGGGQAKFEAGGRLMTASFPSSANTWTVRSRDYKADDAGEMTAFAIAIEDPDDDWEVEINQVESESAQHPAADAPVPEGFALVGGGAEVFAHDDNRDDLAGSDCSNGKPHNFMTHTHPLADMSAWHGASKDHLEACPGVVVVYAIGLRSKSGRAIQTSMVFANGAEKPHPAASLIAELDEGQVSCGGIAAVSETGAGQILHNSHPITEGEEPEAPLAITGWEGGSKDHIVPSPAAVSLFLVQIEQATE